MVVFGAELAQRPFLQSIRLSIHYWFLLIYGVAGKTGTSN